MNAALDTTLVIRLSSIGDVLLMSPLLRALRRHSPAAQIDVLVKARYADLLRYNPHVSHVLEFPDDGNLVALLEWRRRIRSTSYELVVDAHDNIRSRILSIGSRNVVRVRKHVIARFAMVHLKRKTRAIPHAVQRYLEIVRPLGMSGDADGLELFMPDSVVASAHAVLTEANVAAATLIGVAPGARHATKRWKAEGFGKAAATLAVEQKSALVLLGDDDDAGLCEAVAREAEKHSPGTRTLNLAGRLSLLETAAVMDKCSIILCNDSGLMHLAAARKRRVVAVFGSTVKELGFSPYGTQNVVVENKGLPCRPCSHIGFSACPKGHFRCMSDISPDHVVSAAHALIAQDAQ